MNQLYPGGLKKSQPPPSNLIPGNPQQLSSSSSQTVTLRFSDRDEVHCVSYSHQFNMARFVDRLCYLHNINKADYNVMHRGRQLSTIDPSKTMQECNVQAGDVILFLFNQQKKNPIGWKLDMMRRLNNQGITKVTFEPQLTSQQHSQERDSDHQHHPPAEESKLSSSSANNPLREQSQDDLSPGTWGSVQGGTRSLLQQLNPLNMMPSLGRMGSRQSTLGGNAGSPLKNSPDKTSNSRKLSFGDEQTKKEQTLLQHPMHACQLQPQQSSHQSGRSSAQPSVSQDLQSKLKAPSADAIAQATGASSVMRPIAPAPNRAGGSGSNFMNLLDSVWADEIENPFGLQRRGQQASGRQPQPSAASSSNPSGGGRQQQNVNQLIMRLLQQLNGQGQGDNNNQNDNDNSFDDMDDDNADQQMPSRTNPEAFLSQIRRATTTERPPADPALVQQCVEMGFEESRAKRALKFFRNNLGDAIEHIANTTTDQDDMILGPDTSSEQQEQQEESLSSQALRAGQQHQQQVQASSSSQRPGLVQNSNSQGRSQNSQPMSMLPSFAQAMSQQMPSSDSMVRQEQAPQQMQQQSVVPFQPDQGSLDLLIEMGYGRSDCEIALRLSDNNIEEACQLLMTGPLPLAEPAPVVTVSRPMIPANPMNIMRPGGGQGQQSQGVYQRASSQQQQNTGATANNTESNEAQSLLANVNRLEQEIARLQQQANIISRINQANHQQQQLAQRLNQISGSSGQVPSAQTNNNNTNNNQQENAHQHPLYSAFQQFQNNAGSLGFDEEDDDDDLESYFSNANRNNNPANQGNNNNN